MNHVFVVQAKNTKSVAGPYKINNENNDVSSSVESQSKVVKAVKKKKKPVIKTCGCC